MTSLTVRVTPRAGRTDVRAGPDGEVLVRVRAAPEGGKATAEAAEALAMLFGIPTRAVTLRTGGRSRTKVFSLEGVSDGEARRVLDAL
jgi:uncharacterized protein YggU (UPF0235/DUF167 family)